MKTYFAEYAIAVVVFLTIDYFWLRSMGPSLYAAEIGPLLRETPNLGVALGFYLLFVAGLVLFVIHPALQSGGLVEVVLKGAFFGLVTYATYDLTNLASIKGFTVKVAVVDMIWGAALSAVVSAITVMAVRALRLA